MARLRNMFSMSSTTGSETVMLPNPDTDSAKNIVTTIVDAGRNTLGVVTAQKIGRDQEKTELSWSHLEKAEWEEMLRFWENNFFFNFTYYSRVDGTRISRVFYIGDRSDNPLSIDVNGIPTGYINCTANVIDTGEGI